MENRQSHGWVSANTGCEMRLVRLGRRGTPVVYVPSSGGDETEFQSYEMDRECAPWVDSGRLQVISVDGRGPAGMFNDAIPPAERIARYAAFERYLVDELLPWVGSIGGGDAPRIVGASYGAFAGANVLLKYPGRVAQVCGLGGVYGLWHRLDGFHDDDVYFHTPLEYLPRLGDPEILSAIRATRGLVLFAAADDPWLESSLSMQRVLEGKNLPHTLEVWPSPAGHHEHWWKQQLRSWLTRFQG